MHMCIMQFSLYMHCMQDGIAIIPTLFPYFLPFCSPYISLHFKHILPLYTQRLD